MYSALIRKLVCSVNPFLFQQISPLFFYSLTYFSIILIRIFLSTPDFENQNTMNLVEFRVVKIFFVQFKPHISTFCKTLLIKSKEIVANTFVCGGDLFIRKFHIYKKKITIVHQWQYPLEDKKVAVDAPKFSLQWTLVAVLQRGQCCSVSHL